MTNTISLDYSIVVPVYNAELSLPELTKRIQQTMQTLNKSFEIILVNDASPDNSWNVIRELESKNNVIKGFNIEQNSGRHHAIVTGFKNASGNEIITMDDDLQHAPEDIPILIEKANAGFDVVFAEFKEQKHKGYKNVASVIKRRIEQWGYSLPRDLFISGYVLMCRKIVDIIASSKETDPYLPRLVIDNIKMNKICSVPVTHQPRAHGTTNYTPWKSIKFFAKMIRYSNLRFRIAIILIFSGVIVTLTRAITSA